MTTPDNPYGDPGQNPPPPPPAYGQPPAYGAPQYGAPQGQPAPYGQAPYGQAPYGQAPYGSPPAGNFGGTLVDWPRRFVSGLVDFIVVPLPGSIIQSIGRNGHNSALISLGSLIALGLAIWNAAQQGRTGQSLGKRLMGTYVVREADGQFIGAGMGVLRWLVHILDAIPCLLGFLWPLWDAKKQTFADKIISTVVVKR
jgi:uncharacterized RDD family membrane protein YckC